MMQAGCQPTFRARFGARLLSLRKRRGLTQVELAHYLGLRRTHIPDLEKGKRNVSLEFELLGIEQADDGANTF
jgi:DNA-binding XRE family transcriptional regulator